MSELQMWCEFCTLDLSDEFESYLQARIFCWWWREISWEREREGVINYYALLSWSL
jgi:hypothetical protein